MNLLFALVRNGLAEAPDRQLLERFYTERDGPAFAELVRRYGPVVWGVCRRGLTDPADAEDAFQATFLVLVRRAQQLTAHPALGPWLHRVAVLTVRNLRRGIHRRAAVGGRLGRELPAPDAAADRTDARIDLDAALAGLPEKYRVPVVLCHLQGLSRREAAERLGCPEGTLSSRLAAALQKLRARLGGPDPAAVLAAIGVMLVPAGLAAATVRVAGVVAVSTLAAAEVSPAVAVLTQKGLRMFPTRKAVLAATVVLVGGLVAAGFGFRPEPAAVAADPPRPATDPKPKVAAAEPKPAEPDPSLVPAYVTGTVRDADGKPVAGAKVAVNGTIGYFATVGGTKFNARAVTPADGTYKLGFKTRPGRTVIVTDIYAECDGFVDLREHFQFDELKVSSDKPGNWDFVLAKGEVIAGRVAEADPGDQIPILVRGPSFSRQFFTRKDGTFEFWVPKGAYTVTAAVHVKPVARDLLLPPEYQTGLIIKRAATAEKVASGTRNLVLTAP